MKLVTWIKSLFSKKNKANDFGRMQHLVVYKSEMDYFDKLKLAKKMEDSAKSMPNIINDEWYTINWSRVSLPVKAQCIELAKADIAAQIESIN